MSRKELRAMSILVGTTIGAGIFGIPYSVAQVGFLPGFFYLLALGGVVLLVNLLYGEVILRTRGDHQLTGYGEIYLGRWGQRLASLSLFISLYGALLAYLIKIGEFLGLIFGRPDLCLFFSLGFFVLAFVAIFFGLRTISRLELVLVGLIIGLIGLIGFPQIDWANFGKLGLNRSNFTLPYGIMLFALAGSSAVPEAEEVLRKHHKKLKKVIVWGSLIPLLTYVFFTFVIVGISGLATSDDAISGLWGLLPTWVVDVGAALGILAMGTSFLTLGYVLREVWYRDYKLSRGTALVLACLPSLILFLLGAKNFIAVLEITGALTGGLTGVLIIWLYSRAKRGLASPKFIKEGGPAYHLRIPSAILWGLGVVFLLGMFSPWL